MQSSAPSTTLSPWPHRWAVVLACATFPLVWVGGLVTTTDAGMAVPDWPSTFGYNMFLYPWQSWLAGPWDLFVEHGHRLLASSVGLMTIGLVIVLAGSRASWLTYGLVLAWTGWRTLGVKRLLAVFGLGAALLVAAALVSPPVAERLNRSTAVLTGDAEGVDHALSGRSRIWSAALCMAGNHPVNGVGARGFRQAFPACDARRGERAAWGDGPALHAHQVVLESVGLSKPRQIEPVLRPTLAVSRRCQEPIDQPLIGVRRLVRQVCQ